MRGQKKWYIAWRGNPQLVNGGYYRALGQISKTSAKHSQRCVYGSLSITDEFDNEQDYNRRIEYYKAKGYFVR